MKKIKWICFLILFLCFVMVAYLVLEGKTDSFDNFIYDIVTFNKSNFLTGFYKFVTYFASEVMIILVSLIFFLFLKRKRYGVLVILNAVIIFALNVCLKLIFMRERPFDLMIITENGYSFPSGHAMASFGFYGFIIYLIWGMNFDKKAKIIFSILLGLLILMIGISRIYLGVHYASDVLAGYLISGAYLIIYITLSKRFLYTGICFVKKNVYKNKCL